MGVYNGQNNSPFGGGGPLAGNYSAEPLVEVNSVLRLTYLWLGLGLLVTLATAWFVGNTPALLEMSMQPAMRIIAPLVGFGALLVLMFGYNRLPPTAAAGLYFFFTAVEGFVLAIVMVAYLSPTITLPSGEIVTNSFYNPTPLYAAALTTAGLFGAMTVIGFTTKMDLSKMGTYLFMALIGLLIAMVVNIFLQSSGLDFIISIAGVIIFTGLIAYDTQRLKVLSHDPNLAGDDDAVFRLSVMGAVSLYLNILNLFLFLLSLFSND